MQPQYKRKTMTSATKVKKNATPILKRIFARPFIDIYYIFHALNAEIIFIKYVYTLYIRFTVKGYIATWSVKVIWRPGPSTLRSRYFTVEWSIMP